jgi:hypothetical protein
MARTKQTKEKKAEGAGARFDEKKIDDLKRKEVYLDISNKKATGIKLGGAKNRWNKQPDFIYVRKWRIAGPRDRVLTFLSERGSNATAEDLESGKAYTRTNVENNAAIRRDFERESNDAKKVKPKKKSPVPHTYTLDQVLEWDLTKVTHEAKAETAAKKGKKGGKKGSHKNVDLQAFADSKADRYIDVSKFDGHKGLKSVLKSDVTEKDTNYVVLDGIPFIARFDDTGKGARAGFVKAMNALGEGHQKYVDMYDDVIKAVKSEKKVLRHGRAASPRRAASPSAKRSASPPKGKAANLPPV